MEQLIKQTGKTPILSGYEKTAILLGELGPENSIEILNKLNLSPKQTRLIRKEIKKLGKYDRNNFFQVGKELQVLNETVSYVEKRALIRRSTMNKSSVLNIQNNDANEISQAAKKNPDEIAKILKSWLGD